jgi:hypothetical protein
MFPRRAAWLVRSFYPTNGLHLARWAHCASAASARAGVAHAASRSAPAWRGPLSRLTTSTSELSGTALLRLAMWGCSVELSDGASYPEFDVFRERERHAWKLVAEPCGVAQFGGKRMDGRGGRPANSGKRATPILIGRPIQGECGGPTWRKAIRTSRGGRRMADDFDPAADFSLLYREPLRRPALSPVGLKPSLNPPTR